MIGLLRAELRVGESYERAVENNAVISKERDCGLSGLSSTIVCWLECTTIVGLRKGRVRNHQLG